MARKKALIEKDLNAAEDTLFELSKKLRAAKYFSKDEITSLKDAYKKWKSLVDESVEKIENWGDKEQAKDREAYKKRIDSAVKKLDPGYKKMIKEMDKLQLELEKDKGSIEREEKFGPLKDRQARYVAVKKAASEKLDKAMLELTALINDATKNVKYANAEAKLAESHAKSGDMNKANAAKLQAKQYADNVAILAKDFKRTYDKAQSDLAPHRENKGEGKPATYGLEGGKETEPATKYVNNLLVKFAQFTRLGDQMDTLVQAAETAAGRAEVGAATSTQKMEKQIEFAKQLGAKLKQVYDNVQKRYKSATTPNTSKATELVTKLKKDPTNEELLAEIDRIRQQQKFCDDALSTFSSQQQQYEKLYKRLKELPDTVKAMREVRNILGDAEEQSKELIDTVADVSKRADTFDKAMKELETLAA